MGILAVFLAIGITYFYINHLRKLDKTAEKWKAEYIASKSFDVKSLDTSYGKVKFHECLISVLAPLIAVIPVRFLSDFGTISNSTAIFLFILIYSLVGTLYNRFAFGFELKNLLVLVGLQLGSMIIVGVLFRIVLR
ncbi:hypothetical protein K8I28_11115 [bacterium]|nr:hypothetical protein [bacterium]